MANSGNKVYNMFINSANRNVLKKHMTFLFILLWNMIPYASSDWIEKQSLDQKLHHALSISLMDPSWIPGGGL